MVAPYDIYIDTNHDGVADGVIPEGTTISGTDENNNEVPDFVDDFAMNYPPPE